MNDPIYVHALRYATEATKVYLMDEYKNKFPHIFQFAYMETRPATPEDYFIPPSLSNKCIVVVKTYFEEVGCQRLSCFPLKDEWNMCTENDSPRWIPMGEYFEMACQQSCKDHAINTEWIGGHCFVANPLKKILASMPEKLFERASRHIYHGGLNIIDGTLKLNRRYCEAYGLDFFDDDCVASGGQSFGEWLFGKTPIRAAKSAHIKPYNFQPPPFPQYLNYQSPRKRNKRSTLNPVVEYDKELVVDLVKELGQEVSEWAVEVFLKSKAPRLLTRTMDSVAVRLVLKDSMISAIKRMGTLGLRAAAKGFSIITSVYALYELGVGILDILDTYDFNKVLDKKTVEEIDKELDYKYFKDGTIRPELTPEYVWENGILQEDESDKFEFMIKKVEEYLNALQAIPPIQKEALRPNLNLFAWEKKQKSWNTRLFTCITIVTILFVFLFIEYIDVWASCLFFLKVYFKI